MFWYVHHVIIKQEKQHDSLPTMLIYKKLCLNHRELHKNNTECLFTILPVHWHFPLLLCKFFRTHGGWCGTSKGILCWLNDLSIGSLWKRDRVLIEELRIREKNTKHFKSSNKNKEFDATDDEANIDLPHLIDIVLSWWFCLPETVTLIGSRLPLQSFINNIYYPLRRISSLPPALVLIC